MCFSKLFGFTKIWAGYCCWPLPYSVTSAVKGTFMVVYIFNYVWLQNYEWRVFTYASWAWALFDYTAGPQLQEWHFILIWLAIHSSNQMKRCLNEVLNQEGGKVRLKFACRKTFSLLWLESFYYNNSPRTYFTDTFMILRRLKFHLTGDLYSWSV